MVIFSALVKLRGKVAPVMYVYRFYTYYRLFQFKYQMRIRIEKYAKISEGSSPDQSLHRSLETSRK